MTYHEPNHLLLSIAIRGRPLITLDKSLTFIFLCIVFLRCKSFNLWPNHRHITKYSKIQYCEAPLAFIQPFQTKYIAPRPNKPQELNPIPEGFSEESYFFYKLPCGINITLYISSERDHHHNFDKITNNLMNRMETDG